MDNIYSKIRDIEENLQNLKLVENASFNDLTLVILNTRYEILEKFDIPILNKKNK